MLQSKPLTPNDFSLLDEITTHFIGFERHYEAIAQSCETYLNCFITTFLIFMYSGGCQCDQGHGATH